MYVRVIRFVLGPDRQWEAEHIADVIATMTLNQPGCMGYKFYADHHTGEYESTSYWDTLENWEVSFKVMWPEFVNMIGDHFQWRPIVQMFEEYTPKILSLPKV